MAFKRVYTAPNQEQEQIYSQQNIPSQNRFKRIQPQQTERSLSNFTKQGYQLPSNNDPFYDSAKQVAYQGIKGAAGSLGDIVNLITTGLSKGLGYLGVPQEVLDLTNQYYDYIRPQTSSDIDMKARSLGINPEAQTTAGKISGNIANVVGSSAALGSSPRSIGALATGEALGEGSVESGLPEEAGTAIKIASAFFGGSKKGLIGKKSQEPLINFLRSQNLIDPEITVLLQSPAKVATLSKYAVKGEKASSLAKSVKQKVGNIYEYLKSKSTNSPILTTQQKDSLLNDMLQQRNKLPLVWQKAIDPIINRFSNGIGSIEDLILFYQDINASTRGVQGGKAILNTFKPFASKNISLLNPEIGREFELTNELYQKAAKFRNSFKSDLIDKGLNLLQLKKLATDLIDRNWKSLAKTIGAYGARILSREALINPKFQNITKRLGIALQENKPAKIRTALRQIQKQFPEFEQENSSSRARS